ncbi:uncharacterized protein LOC104901275 [Beta vulgaris subsp. vulgaris]|uniref:uncharacterized protein LOC104901275 n=1 Tax=Beta vulgaris subsp. vulgaris TaxID=3555 RepID=UPI00053F3481|nr:uncharacterized protein LOC104901275 [Beta vulgaris subsp. vulgaris]
MASTEANANVKVDPSTVLGSVYYIHPADSSNTKLVHVLFDGNSYNDWKRSIMLGLSSRNKLGFVDGSLKCPAPTDVDYKAWQRCNDLVLGWLLFSLEKNVAKSVWFCKTAKDLWKDLEERYGHTSATQQFTLEQSLSELHQEKNEPIYVFFTKIKAIWDEMDNIDPLPYMYLYKLYMYFV